MHKPEYRLKSKSIKRLDKTEALKPLFVFEALTTDTRVPEIRNDIQSALTPYIKCKLTRRIAAQGLTSQPLKIEIFYETPEYRLKSLRGQDRSMIRNYQAREIDKGYFTFSVEEDESKIYNPTLCYK